MIDHDDTIESAIRDGISEMARQKEAWLLEIFGSYEVAERMGKYFDLEEHPVDMVEGEGGTIRFVQKCELKYKPFDDLEVIS